MRGAEAIHFGLRHARRGTRVAGDNRSLCWWEGPSSSLGISRYLLRDLEVSLLLLGEPQRRARTASDQQAFFGP